MKADDLRAVAADIREKANAATAGPYTYRPTGGGGRWIESAADGDPYRVLGAYNADLADVQHMIRWHPAVALAVADWLDAVASRADEIGKTLPVSIRDDVITHNTTGYTEALAFVKAWRGETS